MSNWTTGELRVLRDAHATRRPGMVELALLLPRHTQEAVRIRSEILGLRTKQRNLLHWLRIAHRHFSQREAVERDAGSVRANPRLPDAIAP